MIFPTDTLQQNIEITDLKLFLACENTSVQIILATIVKWTVNVQIASRGRYCNDSMQEPWGPVEWWENSSRYCSIRPVQSELRMLSLERTTDRPL